jgi:hypothetical protein
LKDEKGIDHVRPMAKVTEEMTTCKEERRKRLLAGINADEWKAFASTLWQFIYTVR